MKNRPFRLHQKEHFFFHSFLFDYADIVSPLLRVPPEQRVELETVLEFLLVRHFVGLWAELKLYYIVQGLHEIPVHPVSKSCIVILSSLLDSRPGFSISQQRILSFLLLFLACYSRRALKTSGAVISTTKITKN